MQDRNTQVIAAGNQKDGVGKTANTVHLAAALGQLGRKYPVWDPDMNHSATLHFGIPPEAFDGTFMVLAEERTPEEVIIDQTTGPSEIELPDNVDVIPSSRELERVEAVLAAKDRFCDARRILIAPIRRLRGKYDYLFLDTAPNATAPAIASYVAAGWFIVPVIPESFALNGMRECLKDIRRAAVVPRSQKAGRKLAIEKLTKYNKFPATPSEKFELERLAARLSGALGVSVKSSQVIRACLIQLLHSESEIVRVAEKMTPPKRPSNSEPVALAEFDQVLAALLSQAFRQTKPIK